VNIEVPNHQGRERRGRNGQSEEHQQKNVLLRTDRARFRTNSVRSLPPLLPDLPCLLASHFLRLLHADAPLSLHSVQPACCGPTPSTCLPLVSAPLSSRLLVSCLLLAVARVRRLYLLPSHLWQPRSGRFPPLPSAAILPCLFLSPHPTVISIIPLLFTRCPARPPCRPPTLVGFPFLRRA